MKSIRQYLGTIRALLISPAGVSMTEHIVSTLLMMVAYMVLFRRFGLDMAGLWVLLMAMLNYAHVGDIWSKGLLSFMGEERGRGRPDAAASYASTAIMTGAAGYFILMAATGMVLFHASPYLFGEDQEGIIRANLHLLVMANWLIASSGNFRQAFIGFGLPVFSAIQRISGSLIFLIGTAVYPTEGGLVSIFHIQIAQGAAMLGFGSMIYFGYVVRPIRHTFWDRRKLDPLIRFGARLLAVSAVQSASDPLIKFLIGQYAGLPAVAVLELALRLIQGVRGLILSTGQVVITYFARICGQKNGAEDDRITAEFYHVSRIIIGGSVLAFALLFSFAPLVEWVFFMASAQAPGARLFPVLLLVFGAGWLVNSMVSSGYFLLVAMRQARPLFIAELIRAGMIAGCGLMLGHAFGAGGFLAAVMLGFILSSFYLFGKAAAKIHQPVFLVLKNVAGLTSSVLPLAWAFCVVMIWIMKGATAFHPRTTLPLVDIVLYLIGPVGTFILVARFGRLDDLTMAIRALKP
ncbi:lipopolysaccharide biosynthesis protein [Alphaproteobacteria bacterium LSUCC0684]